jgi:hypothetical protein
MKTVPQTAAAFAPQYNGGHTVKTINPLGITWTQNLSKQRISRALPLAVETALELAATAAELLIPAAILFLAGLCLVVFGG